MGIAGETLCHNHGALHNIRSARQSQCDAQEKQKKMNSRKDEEKNGGKDSDKGSEDIKWPLSRIN